MQSTRAAEFGPWARVCFVASYFTAKLRLPLEVTSPKFRFVAFELIYTAANVMRSVFKRLNFRPTWPFYCERVSTRFGTFQIRRNTEDAAIISPAFERADLTHLLALIQSEVKRGRSILFLDVGANIGKFSVAVWKAFKDSNVRILCFEPIQSNFALLNTNLRLNGANPDHVVTLQFALSDQEGEMTMMVDPKAFGNATLSRDGIAGATTQRSEKVKTLRLDSKSPVVGEHDSVFIKIDAERSEAEVLSGAELLIRCTRRGWILIEDSLESDRAQNILEKYGCRFLCKKTSYNSWWSWDRSEIIPSA